jgi:HEPN domain-containing protein
MTPRDEARLWTQNADGDFNMVDVAVRAGLSDWNQICFHAQQGAEKYLKALLIAGSSEPPRTHNLSLLLELAGANHGGLQVLAPDCALLTPFAVTERYATRVPDDTTARAVIAAGYRVRDAVRRLLG